MSEQKMGPLGASFWLTDEEKRYVLFVCAILLVGIAARYWHLRGEQPEPYAPHGIEQEESDHE